MNWVEQVFISSFQTISDQLDQSIIKSEIPRIYDTIPDVLKVKKGSTKNQSSKNLPNLLSLFDTLKDVLHEAHICVMDKFAQEHKRKTKVESENKETKKFKNEILVDFKNLEKQMLDLTKELDDSKAKIENFQAEILDKNSQINRKDNSILDIKQDNNIFIWDVIYLLNGIKTKFQNYQIVAENVQDLDTSMMRVLQNEINDPERCKGLTYDEKKTAVKTLINIISDITTTLHYENKQLMNSDEKVKELNKQIEEQRAEFNTKLDKAVLSKEREIVKAKQEYDEKYMSFMSTSKEEYEKYESKIKED